MNKTDQSHNMVFFGKTGASSSQASYIANLVKETNTIVSRRLDGLKAFNYEVHMDGIFSAVSVSTKLENTSDFELEGPRYALSSWLNEGIKAKKRLLDFYKSCDLQEFLNDGEIYPVFTESLNLPLPPQKPQDFTLENAVGELNVAERAEYLTLEAQASHIGKYIHPDGVLSRIKNDLATGPLVGFHKVLQQGQPTELPVRGRPNFEDQQINDLYFELQAKHRRYESQLNNYKARLQNRVTEVNAERQRDYANALAAYNKEYAARNQEYTSKLNQYTNDLNQINSVLQTRRLEKIREVSAYNIVIPHDLQPIYDDLNKLGK